jgi:2-methylisocitrate lyase-like PEP mutase family enzyme
LCYPDGDTLPTALAVATVAAVTRVVRVPVSADIEGGYSSDPAAVGELAGRIVDAGAVGINLEERPRHCGPHLRQDRTGQTGRGAHAWPKSTPVTR